MDTTTCRFSTCRRCGKEFGHLGRWALHCPACRPAVKAARKAAERSRETKSTTQTRNGRGGFTLIPKRPTSKNGEESWAKALPDHSRDTSRDQVHTSSDILHATPEKSIAILNRILSGKDTYVG